MTSQRPIARILAASLFAMAAAAPLSAMSGYKWAYRPLVVFAPSAAAPELARQRSIVSAVRPAFQDRKVVVIYVVGDDVSAELGPTPGQSAQALRSHFGIGAGSFRAVLVGKDGGVKLSSGAPIPSATLFSLIDAMPMRKDEMKRR